MIERRTRFRLYIGWWMVVITAILTGVGSGFIVQGFSVIFKPLAAELSLNRAATSLAAGMARLQGGIEGPLTGWLADRYGAKWIIVVGIGVLVSGLALMNSVDSAWQYYVYWGVMIGVGQNLALTIAIDKTLSDWFVARRGLAFGIRFAIVSLCQMIVVPITTWLVLAEGWRTTCLIWAGVMSLGIPITLIFIRSKRPEYYGWLPDGYTSEETPTSKKDILHAGISYAERFEEQEFTLKQALRTRAFWLMVFGWSCSIIVIRGVTVHIIPFLTDMGISEEVAGAMLSMMIFFTIPSRFFGGFLADHVPKNRLQLIAAGSVFLQAVGLLTFFLYQSIATAYILLILFGLGNGAMAPLRLSMGARYFGRKAFASILGIGLFINAPLGFISPIYSGWIFDTTGAYSLAFLTFAILLMMSTIILLSLHPPEFPKETRI